MATRPSRPALRARYDRRRQEILLGAARVFAQHGYDQTAMPGLAEALGLATGSLYHYFPGKEQLLMGICDQLLDPLLEQARALLEREERPEEQLRALVRLWVAHVVACRDHMLVFQQERHVIERGAAWRGVRASRKSFERLVEEVLAHVDEAGAATLADRRLALWALLGMVNHTAQWYRARGPLDAQQIADGYVDLLLAGSGAVSSSAGSATR
ncbi:MAG TPA: TetR/AcrR family transcriptional regulator [Solirubrobacteraceae bacterium]|nr:TetR/AcrR family transcriptional regulator [Solirubrobacteraceae bacterium]